MPLILTNANLIDCVDEGVTPDATVVIDDDRIAEVGPGRAASASATVIDLRGAFLLPGLWDVHIHPEYPVPPGMTVAQETANFGRSCPGPSPRAASLPSAVAAQPTLWTSPGNGSSTPAT